MKTILIINVFFIIFCSQNIIAKRSFSIDYPNNRFLKDGQPFRYVSGSLHYFRVPSVLWEDRMVKYRAAGLNAIQTYIEWSSLEVEPGIYDFTGDNDLFGFLRIANKHNLSVLLRAGPYIDAERDMGGFPYWLLSIDPQMRLRSSDPKFMTQIYKWYSYLLPKLRPYLYGNGGPVIAVQIENEFGVFGCDFIYLTQLRDLFIAYLGKDVVLFTTDNNRDDALKCGKIDGVFATVDFGIDSDPGTAFAIQRRHQEFGPNVNSEFYSGWLDYWERPHSVTNVSSVCNTLDQILALNASVNVYVFYGGTSFGFSAGANIDSDTFYACPTSYDYDAPLNEAGDPTLKYYAIRDIVGKYLPLPDIPVPTLAPKMETNPILMKPLSNLFDLIKTEESINSLYPLTFEQLGQRNGFVLYLTNISFQPSDPAVLTIEGLGDRALVFVDSEFVGTLSRTQKLYKIPINVRKGSSLQILVENQGRICSGSGLKGDLKGITSNVTLGPVVLHNWDHFRVFKNWSQKLEFIENSIQYKSITTLKQRIPTFYSGQFTINEGTQPLDTFLSVEGWRKGIAFLNGFNLGRYWPISGPQLTLYSPKHLFKPYPQSNQLVLFELEGNDCVVNTGCMARFVKNHIINGSTPYQTYNEFSDDLNTFESKDYIYLKNESEFDIQLNDIQFV